MSKRGRKRKARRPRNVGMCQCCGDVNQRLVPRSRLRVCLDCARWPKSRIEDAHKELVRILREEPLY